MNIEKKNMSESVYNRLKNIAFNIWVEYLLSYLDQEDDDTKDKPAITKWTAPKYFTGSADEITKMEQLDRFADNVGEEVLEALLAEESETASGRVGMFARKLFGGVKMESRRVVQSQFNQSDSFPRVLIAQSMVGREGLNLHRACDIVIQFHSEWNPGIIEQQIGRVDRIESLWEQKARAWKKNGRNGEMPKILIVPVVFEGTYDSYQFSVSKRRREVLNAHLFGELFNEEAQAKLSKDEKLLQKIKESAPSFSPPVGNKQ